MKSVKNSEKCIKDAKFIPKLKDCINVLIGNLDSLIKNFKCELFICPQKWEKVFFF